MNCLHHQNLVLLTQYDLDHEQLITQYPEVEELFLDTISTKEMTWRGTISNFKFDFVINCPPQCKYHKPAFWNLSRNYNSNDISTDKNLVVSNFLIKNKNNFQRRP